MSLSCILISWYHQCWILAVQFNVDITYSNHDATWALFDTQCIVLSWDCSRYHMIISLWPSDAIWRQKYLGQYWLRWWFVAWQHQAVTWINVDWSSVRSSDIHIRAFSQERPQPWITKIRLKITYLKLHSNFPGANELSYTWPESAFGKGRHWLKWWFGWSGNRPPHEPNVIWILNAILWHQTNMKLTGLL